MDFKNSSHYFKDYSKMSKQELLDVIENMESEIWSLREEINTMEHQHIMKGIEERKRKESEEVFKAFPQIKNNIYDWE